jgi:hypothetical protein
MIDDAPTSALAQYACVLALDPHWDGRWVELARRAPAVAGTLRQFDGPGCGRAFVLAPGAVDLEGVAAFLADVDAAGEGGPYGGLAVVSEHCIFHTNWELVEATEWRFTLPRLRDGALARFVEVFGTTGMELEFTRHDGVLTIQHVDHEQPGGIESSRGRLPRLAVHDPARFVTGVAAVVSLIDALDARCGYWSGAASS